MQRRHSHAVWTLCLVLALAACTSPADGSTSGAADKGYISGNGSVRIVAPSQREKPIELKGTTLEGAALDVAKFRGSVVVINVWGSWCPPCIAEAPALQQVWEETEPEGVQFIGIDTRDGVAQARAHQRKFQVTYPSLRDPDGRLLLALRGTLPPVAIPSTLVLDADGRVAARILGATSAGVLKGIIEDVVAESPSAA